MEKTKVNKQKARKSLPVKYRKFEKQHQKNPNICVCCGQETDEVLIMGICQKCYQLIVKEANNPKNVYVVTEEQANAAGIRRK